MVGGGCLRPPGPHDRLQIVPLHEQVLAAVAARICTVGSLLSGAIRAVRSWARSWWERRLSGHALFGTSWTRRGGRRSSRRMSSCLAGCWLLGAHPQAVSSRHSLPAHGAEATG